MAKYVGTSVHVVLAGAWVITFSGCAGPAGVHYDDIQEQAGSTHVAVLSAGRWSNYRDALAPDFKLSAGDALTAALPNTQDIEEKSLSAFSGTVKIALPSGGKPGDASSVSLGASPAAGLNAKDLGPANSVLGTAIATDPFLRYSAATALLQEVSLLDSYVKDALADPDYEPYLVRIQVSLMPKHHDAPYDAYTTISFFPGDYQVSGNAIGPNTLDLTRYEMSAVDSPEPTTAETPPKTPAQRQARKLQAAAVIVAGDRLTFAKRDESSEHEVVDVWAKARADLISLDPMINPTCMASAIGKIFSDAELAAMGHVGIKVVPLIVTDDLESASHSNATEQVRQFALGLSAVIHGIGGSADLQKVDQNLRTLLGHDFNSTFTIARASDNSIRIRFGAAQQVGSQYAMVPQTHNVSLLILVPRGFVSPLTRGGDIRLMSQTVFVNTRTGTELRARNPNDLQFRADTVTQRYGFRVSAVQTGALMSFVDHNDFSGFADQVSRITTPTPGDYQAARAALNPAQKQFEAMWLDFVALHTGGQYNFQQFHLPRRREPAFLIQTPLLIDDGKASATANLYGNQDLDASKISAILEVTDDVKKETNRLAATSVKTSPDGRLLTLGFPSVGALDLVHKDPPPTKSASLCDIFVPKSPAKPTANYVYKILVKNEEAADEGATPTEFKVSRVLAPPKDQGPSSKVLAGAKLISADAAGNGQLELIFTKNNPDESVTFTIDGADTAGPKKIDGIADDVDIPANPPSPARTATVTLIAPAASANSAAGASNETVWQVNQSGVAVFPLRNLGVNPVIVHATVKSKATGKTAPLPDIILPVYRQPNFPTVPAR